MGWTKQRILGHIILISLWVTFDLNNNFLASWTPWIVCNKTLAICKHGNVIKNAQGYNIMITVKPWPKVKTINRKRPTIVKILICLGDICNCSIPYNKIYGCSDISRNKLVSSLLISLPICSVYQSRPWWSFQWFWQYWTRNQTNSSNTYT